MRKSILSLAIVTFMLATVSTLIGQETDKKSDKARENLQEAKQDLKEAKKDSVSDYQKFRNECNLKIKDNEKSIAELKAKHLTVSENEKIAYHKKVSALEQKNKDLKFKLVNYKNDKSDNWLAFKSEFNHDMDELGTALKDFTVNNKK